MEEKAKKILVAVDGSKNSERAVIEAKKYAELITAEITLLTVIKPLATAYYGNMELSKVDSEKLESGKEAVLNNALKLFEGYNGEVHTKLRKGNPADEILKEAEDGEYDLIVMGSKGLGAFSRTILGSVSNKILNHTRTNVLIIK